MARHVRRPRTDAEAAKLTKEFPDALPRWRADGKSSALDKPDCGEMHSRLSCTRPEGHKPPHAAAGKTLVVLVWDD